MSSVEVSQGVTPKTDDFEKAKQINAYIDELGAAIGAFGKGGTLPITMLAALMYEAYQEGYAAHKAITQLGKKRTDLII